MRYLLVATYAAAPLVALAADNGRLVTPGDLAPWYLGIAVPALAVTAVVAWLRGPKAADLTAVVLAVGILVVFDYWDLRPALSSLTHDARPSMVFLWAVVFGIAVFATVRAKRRVRQLPMILLAVGVAILVPSLIGWAQARTERPTAVEPGRAEAGHRLVQHPAPNVYFFMLDAYGRPDRLRQQFGFDDSPFVRRLRSEGFVVPADSETAYPFTTLSVPTMLQMNYVIGHGALEAGAAGPLMRGHDEVVDTFRALGYSFVHAPSDLPDWTCDGSEDRCIHATETYAKHLGLSPLAWAITERTPVADLMRSVAPVHLNPLTARRQFPLHVAHDVEHLRLRRPVFTFTHVLLTHWPYLYLGARCRLAAVRGKLGAKAYIQAVTCANANTQAALRLILQRDPHAVIILASDHGSDVSLPGGPQEKWPRVNVARRFSNFLALRLPQQCRHDVPNRIFTPNIFRVVFNCLTDPDMPLVDNRRYFATPNLAVDRDESVRR